MRGILRCSLEFLYPARSENVFGKYDTAFSFVGQVLGVWVRGFRIQYWSTKNKILRHVQGCMRFVMLCHAGLTHLLFLCCENIYFIFW